MIQVASVGGMTQLNDKLFTVTVVGPDTVTLDGVNGTAFGAYTSGGTATVGTFHAARPETRMRDFTAGTALATDHWGATGVAAMMSPLPGAGFLRTDYAQNGYDKRYGRGANAVLSGALSGSDWIDTGLGLPSPSGISDGTSGSNLFGNDYFYQQVRDLLCPISGGTWGNATTAGVWALSLSGPRSGSSDIVGARAGLYL